MMLIATPTGGRMHGRKERAMHPLAQSIIETLGKERDPRNEAKVRRNQRALKALTPEERTAVMREVDEARVSGCSRERNTERGQQPSISLPRKKVCFPDPPLPSVPAVRFSRGGMP